MKYLLSSFDIRAVPDFVASELLTSTNAGSEPRYDAGQDSSHVYENPPFLADGLLDVKCGLNIHGEVAHHRAKSGVEFITDDVEAEAGAEKSCYSTDVTMQVVP